MIRFIVPLLSLGIFDCPGNSANWVRFNAGDDEITVEVTRSLDLGESVSEDLLSTTGSVVVGTILVDPGSGPVGTMHTVLVDVEDEYEEIVRRVTITVDAGQRGAEEFDMQRDSADHSLWEIELESTGVEGETRIDVFRPRLYEDDPDVEATDEDTD